MFLMVDGVIADDPAPSVGGREPVLVSILEIRPRRRGK
jgi:hypothetical protein